MKWSFFVGALMFSIGICLVTRLTDNLPAFVIGMVLLGGSYGLAFGETRNKEK